MEEEDQVNADERRYHDWGLRSSEIVEIGEDNQSIISSKNGGNSDVYVAVGKNDLPVVKWALDHLASPGTKVILVHVFRPITYIPTPVGKLSRSQLTKAQVQAYINEELNRRQKLLAKYIQLCTDSKVTVDTMLLESNAITKAILDLIPVLYITNLVMGTKRYPYPRQLMKGQGKGDYVRKNAPDFCEVSIIHDGKRILNGQQQQGTENVAPALVSNQAPENIAHSERSFFEWICFSGKFK